MSTLRPEFHTSLVSQALDDIYYQRSSLYYFLGKIDSWGNVDTPPGSLSDSVENDITIRNNLLYIRRITPSETSLVTSRYIWSSGTVYDFWDHTIDMTNKEFYVVTEEFNVYKCLDNNNGAESTVQPTTNSLFPFRTDDGYLWKYMYTIPSFKRTKFLSRNYLPVQRALTDSFYNKGAVEQVVVTAGGSGYTDEQLTTIQIDGTTTGAGATAVISGVDSLGRITEMTVTDGGSGYTNGATVSITTLTGTSAELEIVQSGGEITDITIVNSGAGYSIDDDITISVGGAVLTPIVSQDTGSILEVRIDAAGSGYTSAPDLTIIQSPDTGTGKYGNPDAIIKAIVYQGSIVGVTIEDPGVNYPTDTATTIVVSGDGSGASFSPVIRNGELVDVIVEESGTDYTYINLQIIGNGENATAEAVLATSDFLSDQSLVEQVAVNGAIYAVVVTERGDNYSSEAEVVITGDGEGATAEAIFSEGGGISYIKMLTYGSGYTYADITISDANRPTPNDFTDTVAYAVLPPLNGHGYDAVKELYGDTISIFTALRDDERLAFLEQDYRQYGLIQNPTNLFTNKRITSSTGFVTFVVTLSDVGSLTVDTVLINNSKRYRVVSINGTSVELQQLNQNYSQPSGVFAEENSPTTQYTISSVTSIPSVNKYSGNLLYTTNSVPFTPTQENSIAIRTYIKL